MKSAALDDILKNPAVWRIGQVPMSEKTTIASGSSVLDDVLPGHGWELGALTEILANDQGIGELSLLIPALREMTRSGRTVILVAPPYLPLPLAWEGHGVMLNRIAIVSAEKQDLLWAIEQSARCGAAGMVVAWEPTNQRGWNYQALRRLHVAADNGRTALLLYRRASAHGDASPAPTRLLLSMDTGELQIRIVKRRGALMPETIRLNLFPSHWRIRTAHAALEKLQALRENAATPVLPQRGLRRLSASR